MSHTRDKPWLIVQTEDENDRDRHLTYLLPDGSRRRVTIDTADDSPVLRAQIGDALNNGRTGIGAPPKHERHRAL